MLLSSEPYYCLLVHWVCLYWWDNLFIIAHCTRGIHTNIIIFLFISELQMILITKQYKKNKKLNNTRNNKTIATSKTKQKKTTKDKTTWNNKHNNTQNTTKHKTQQNTNHNKTQNITKHKTQKTKTKHKKIQDTRKHNYTRITQHNKTQQT